MPTLADMEAAVPKCDRPCGALAMRGACGQSMRWVTLTSPTDGNWVCAMHGPMLSGEDAAIRAGFRPYVAESEAA
jgi:hypothetical protein